MSLPLSEQISNRWGRRIAIWTGTALLIVGGLWNAFAQDAGQFIGSRVIIGSGGAIAKVSAPALLVEIAHPRLRPVLGGIYFGLYYSGSFMSAVMCSEWRCHIPIAAKLMSSCRSLHSRCMELENALPPAMYGAPVGFCIHIYRSRVPSSESDIGVRSNPQFLIKIGKNEQALNALAKYHANGDVNDELVQWEYHEVQSTIHQEEAVQSSYFDFFRTAGNRRRLMVIVSISVGTNWVGNSLISFYLAPILRSVGVTDPVKIASINAGLAIWNLTIAVSAGTQVRTSADDPCS